MKKILLFSFLFFLIPAIIVNLFIRDDEIKFEYHENMIVRIKRTSGEIEEVPFEQYIVGVLAGEMPVDFELEALKAQAVAARSYAINKMQENVKNNYDLVDTVNNQVYFDLNYLKNAWGKNYDEKINKLKTAVIQTNGEYLDYNGQVVYAFFFSTSIGMTENSEEIFNNKLPYLRSVTSLWDRDVSPVYTDGISYSLKDFYSKLNLHYSDTLKVETISTTSTGRIKKIKINGVVLDGNVVQSKLGLRSNYFTITNTNNQIRITTKGYGHGVGMSQYGALGMAKAGYNYEDILKHYYQGTKIKKI
ncbi:MAG: stage II sporulation protein D [Bacilli bacterium]|nr:stage II sporulation protein D [Bacilli bacterium]MDD4808654.1 stage II sporulation protein D [Bacilli bacterium]